MYTSPNTAVKTGADLPASPTLTSLFTRFQAEIDYQKDNLKRLSSIDENLNGIQIKDMAKMEATSNPITCALEQLQSLINETYTINCLTANKLHCIELGLGM